MRLAQVTVHYCKYLMYVVGASGQRRVKLRRASTSTFVGGKAPFDRSVWRCHYR